MHPVEVLKNFGGTSDLFKTYQESLKIDKARLSISLIIYFFLQILYLLKINSKYISPWDEMYHLSYIQYVYNWQVPVIGDVLNSWSQTGFNCREVFSYGKTTPYVCGALSTDIANYPEAGKNTAAIWPPIYYFFAALWQHLFLPFISDPIVSARIFSSFLFALGFSLIAWEGTKHNRENYMYLLFLTIGLGTFAASIYQAIFITPYSNLPLLIFGCFKIINRFQRDEKITTTFVLQVSIFEIFCLLTIPHIVPCLILLLLAAMVYAEKSKIMLLFVFWGFFTAVLIPLFWELFQKTRATDLGNYQNLSDPAVNTLSTLSRLGSIFPQGLLGYQFESLGQILIASWFSYLIFGLIILIIVSKTSRNSVRFFLASLIALSLYSIFLDLYLKFTVPPRYGLSGFFLLSLLIVQSTKQSRFVTIFLGFIAASSSFLFVSNPVFQ